MNIAIAAGPPRVSRRADPAETPWQRAARSDRDALPCPGQVYPAALRMTRNRADAKDLIRETLTRAYAHFGQFKPGTNQRVWLYRILTKTFLSGCRKRQREPQPTPVGEIQDWQLARAVPYQSCGLRSAEAEVFEHQPDALLEAADPAGARSEPPHLAQPRTEMNALGVN